MPPALLTRMSTSPQASTSAPMFSGIDRSNAKGLAPNSVHTLERRSESRATSVRETPSAASALAMARPMPREAPVTSAVRPLRLRSMSVVELEELARKRGAHHLDRAAGDHEAARLAPEALDRHLGRQAHRAVELQAAVGGLEAELGAVDLGHVGLVARRLFRVDARRGAVGEELARLVARVEVGEGELYRLPVGERAPEGAALLRVRGGHLQAALGHAQA